MAFCKYCGSQIPDGGVCGCPEAQAAAQAAAQVAAQVAPAPQPVPQAAPQAAPQPVVQPAPQYQQAPQGYQPYQAPVPAGPNPFGEAFKQFGTFFTKPLALITDAVSGKIPAAAGFILGGLYVLVAWIMLMITCFVMGVGGLSVLWSFIAAIVIGGIRFGIAALISALCKKDGLTFMQSVNACLVASIPCTMCWFLYGTLGLLGGAFKEFFFIAAIAFAFLYYVALIENFVKDKNKAFLFGFIIVGALAIGACVMYGFNYWMASAAAKRAVNSLYSGFSNAIGDLYSWFS